ncbi:MAG TPA: hypothetical protein VGC54_14710 [Planctomycetota bacterium]
MDHLPALHRALRAVPAGGRVLCLDDAPAARSLAASRGDSVVEHRGADLPFAPGEFLAAIAPEPFPLGSAEAFETRCGQLCGVAERYVVIGCRHVLPPWGGGARRRHRTVERAFAAHGWRPLARAARRFLLDPYWVYVFARFGPELPARPSGLPRRPV